MKTNQNTILHSTSTMYMYSISLMQWTKSGECPHDGLMMALDGDDSSALYKTVMIIMSEKLSVMQLITTEF